MISLYPSYLLSAEFYHFLRPYLFRMDPERAHKLTIDFLRLGLGPRYQTIEDPILKTRLVTRVGSLAFTNPLGLAAGFDKQAEVMGAVLSFGFSFIELGSITPLPQSGNPKPRLFRVPEINGIINRFGFNSDGIEACHQRVAAFRSNSTSHQRGLVGINVGKNKENPDAATDYSTGVKSFADLADYITVNISSPNTPGLRDLQRREPLHNLMSHVMKTRDSATIKPPLFVKVAPDLCDEQIEDIADIILSLHVDGIIIGNTTIMRPASVPTAIAQESGGLSGKPLLNITLPILRKFYQFTKGQVPIIGCGGIANGLDAYTMIKAGASLLQIYTALIYEGPSIVNKINLELAELLRRDGFHSIQQAVGKEHELAS